MDHRNVTSAGEAEAILRDHPEVLNKRQTQSYQSKIGGTEHTGEIRESNQRENEPGELHPVQDEHVLHKMVLEYPLQHLARVERPVRQAGFPHWNGEERANPVLIEG